MHNLHDLNVCSETIYFTLPKTNIPMVQQEIYLHSWWIFSISHLYIYKFSQGVSTVFCSLTKITGIPNRNHLWKIYQLGECGVM